MGDGDEAGTHAERPLSGRQRAAFWLVLGVAALWIVFGARHVMFLREVDVSGPPLESLQSPRIWLHMVDPAIKAGLTVWGALLIRSRTVGWQLLGRVLIGGWVVVRFMYSGFSATYLPDELAMLLGLAGALALLGRQGLEPDEGPFQPTRFRGLLTLMILLAGLMAWTHLMPVLEQLTTWLISEHDPTLFLLRPLVLVAAFILTAVGLYNLRAVALLIPVGLALFLGYEELFLLPEWYAHTGDRLPELQERRFWGAIRYGTFLAVLFVPFLAGLVWLRIRARRDRASANHGS